MTTSIRIRELYPTSKGDRLYQQDPEGTIYNAMVRQIPQHFSHPPVNRHYRQNKNPALHGLNEQIVQRKEKQKHPIHKVRRQHHTETGHTIYSRA